MKKNLAPLLLINYFNVVLVHIIIVFIYNKKKSNNFFSISTLAIIDRFYERIQIASVKEQV